jgi:hypothetical protein
MHVPLSAAVMGEAAGEADFGARLVDSMGDLNVRGGKSADDDSDDGDDRDDGDDDGDDGTRKETNEMLEGGVGDGYHVPPPLPEIDGLRWDRRKRDNTSGGGNGTGGGSGGGLEKRAWVVCPGMGHIG